MFRYLGMPDLCIRTVAKRNWSKLKRSLRQDTTNEKRKKTRNFYLKLIKCPAVWWAIVNAVTVIWELIMHDLLDLIFYPLPLFLPLRQASCACKREKYLKIFIWFGIYFIRYNFTFGCADDQTSDILSLSLLHYKLSTGSVNSSLQYK